MPADVLYAIAKQSKKSYSKDELEKLWSRAKKISANQGQTGNYAYTMGIVKNMLNVESDSSEFIPLLLIDSILSGKTSKQVLDDLLSNKLINEAKILDSSLLDLHVRTYFDSYGELKFYSVNESLIDPSTNWLMGEILEFSKSDYPYIVDLLSNYEGSLVELYFNIKEHYTITNGGLQ